jgi:hypothetical protein
MQQLLHDCQKLLDRTEPISLKHPIKSVKKLLGINELKDRISEIGRDVAKARAEFQVCPFRPFLFHVHVRNNNKQPTPKSELTN